MNSEGDDMIILARTLPAIGLLALPVFGTASATTPTPSSAVAAGHHGAPGPIIGAGLPVLAVGYGVYWLVRRRRRKAD